MSEDHCRRPFNDHPQPTGILHSIPICVYLRHLRLKIVLVFYQPWVSRTLAITPRISFQVSCFIMVAFGNMQPSQQMCW